MSGRFAFKKSLLIELFEFFQTLSLDSVTKSALVQARQKIRPLFFRDLFRHTIKLYYRHFKPRRWRGFRLWACDGTGLRLPNEPWIGDHFGWHQNQHRRVPSTRILCTYDVLNSLIVDIQLHSRHIVERSVAMPLIASIPKDVIAIYDRGFAGYALPYLHQLHGSHCIIRLTSTFNPIVKAFINSGKRQQRVRAPMTERATRSLRKLGYKVCRKDIMTYRLIRVDLPHEVEVLMTTLLDTRQWPAHEFKELYRLRWGVETCFHIFKSYFQAAAFSTYKIAGVEQDLWACFALFNMQTACHRALHRSINSLSNRRTFSYQLNRNVGLGFLKRLLPALLLHPLKQLGDRLDRLLHLLIRAVEPVRSQKNRVRKKRLIRGAERHIYEPNYRPSL